MTIPRPGRGRVASRVVAPCGWPSVMGGEFGRLGRHKRILNQIIILDLPPAKCYSTSSFALRHVITDEDV